MVAQNIKHRNINSKHNKTQNIMSSLKNCLRSWIDNSNKNKDKVQNTAGTQEEIEVDREICYFGWKIYTLASVSVFVGVLTFIFALQLKLLHNSFGTHIDMLKLICCIIIISSIEVFIFMKLFDKNNKLTRIKTEVEYREPYENQQSMEIHQSDTINQLNSYCQPDIIPQQSCSYYQRDTFFQSDPSFQTESCDEVIIPKKNTKVDMIHGETQVLWSEQDNSEQDKTVILSKIIPAISYFLIPLNDSDDKKIIVDRFPFVIGKQKTGIDFTVENISVSRRHVRFTREEKGVYLTDLNSTNGTFLNGIKLTENRPYLITDKDEIMLSQLKYVWSVSSKV
ncbi:FHA domain-containing protein [Anaerocolumna sp. MB42-C2]|uniref:FHA domain-containing protein n=1 Tax=Anaerocolumna sp. MB42-C2 TaxID=3070997 RepID=UPI0027E1E87C|nr:FHA domain-containing protein [Anaerocolumna sp. MB42-C2]WMJ85487.1 FHA domain-containing protein [Anaerocolumna sp. MB42-C2]